MSVILATPPRQNAITEAERKAAQKAAQAYLYLFTWQTPMLNERPRAFHCAELPFVFDNTDRGAAMTRGTAEAREPAGKVGVLDKLRPQRRPESQRDSEMGYLHTR